MKLHGHWTVVTSSTSAAPAFGEGSDFEKASSLATSTDDQSGIPAKNKLPADISGDFEAERTSNSL